jgi:hypothetical protein
MNTQIVNGKEEIRDNRYVSTQSAWPRAQTLLTINEEGHHSTTSLS